MIQKKKTNALKNVMMLITTKTHNEKATLKALQAKQLLASKRGENFVDSGIKILIAVVIGALLLGGLYALFGATRRCIVNAKGAARTPPNKALTRTPILPTLTEKVEEMFEFAG